MPNDIVVRSDKNGGKVHLSADRVYDLNEDKTQDTINSELRTGVSSLNTSVSSLSTAKADKTDLAQVVLQATKQTVSANGTTSSISLTGLTGKHVVADWGLFSDSSCSTPISANDPTCDITITTGSGSWTLKIENFKSTFYMKPTFVLPQNI